MKVQVSGGPSRRKYRNRKVKLDGHTFDSQAEARRYQSLKLAERAGTIQNLSLQPQFELLQAFTNLQGKRIRGVKYIADFMYVENGETVVEDVKGARTKEYILKSKWFQSKYPNYKFLEIPAKDV